MVFCKFLFTLIPFLLATVFHTHRATSFMKIDCFFRYKNGRKITEFQNFAHAQSDNDFSQFGTKQGNPESDLVILSFSQVINRSFPLHFSCGDSETHRPTSFLKRWLLAIL